MRITNKLFLSGFIHSSLLNGSLSARLNNMVKMLEVQEERFGGPKGSSRRRVSLNNKQEDQESLYTETEDDGELIPYGTYSGLSKNKDIQDHLINEHAVEHAKLVAKHETKQARIAAEYVADVGILSNDVESNTVDPQDQTVLSELSQPLDVEDRQVQTQRRRLDALREFKDRCKETSGGKGYVNCVGGFVRDISTGLPTSQTCVAACDGECCTGLPGVCDFFTGKVCRDDSCDNDFACFDANIGYVVGPSCTDRGSCSGATIGSVDSSCKEGGSCIGARLIGVDLINSCKKEEACRFATNGNEAFDELNGCCNDADIQCQSKDGLDIVNAGCPNAPSSMPSEVPSQSSEPSIEPSKSSAAPSGSPSESTEPSLAPSNSPRVTSVTVVEPDTDGVSKTVNCCESEDDNNECQSLLAVAEAESLDECASVSPTGPPSKEPTHVPSLSPSKSPSREPSVSQSKGPSVAPSAGPSTVPTRSPSKEPTTTPSQSPSKGPSVSPSTVPTGSPSKEPTSGPSQSLDECKEDETLQCTCKQTGTGTDGPASSPSIGPTSSPSNAKTGKDYLREALASSIFSRYPWAPKASKSSMGKRVKTAKKNIKKALKTDNVFVKIRETSMASEVLGCGTPDTETEEVCSPLSQAVLAFAYDCATLN